MGLLLYAFGFLPCVRVRCGLYPHGRTVVLFWVSRLCESPLRTVSTWTTVLLFWFSPLCESPLQTVYTWAYSFTLLVFSLV